MTTYRFYTISPDGKRSPHVDVVCVDWADAMEAARVHFYDAGRVEVWAGVELVGEVEAGRVAGGAV